MRLIDADALLEALEQITTKTVLTNVLDDEFEGTYTFVLELSDVIGTVKNAPTVKREGWVSVEDRLPDDSKCVLAIVLDKTNLKGWHWEIVNYGEFSFYDADGNFPDADEDGEVKRFGWHYGRESEGEYDYLIFDLNSKVTYWQPLPAAPKE